MDKRVVYINGEGNVSVMIPADNCGLTLEQIISKDVPKNTNYIIIDKSALPDRADRDCYKLEDGVLSICQVKKVEKAMKIQEKADKKSALLTKLGLTENEAKELRKLI